MLILPGIQITVFGTIPARGIEDLRNTQFSAYSIDNGTKSLYRGILQLTPQYKEAFFRSEKLSPTINHTITIENVSQGGTLSIDYVTIITTTPLSLPTAAAQEPTTTSATNSSTESETISQSIMSSSPAPIPTTSEIPGNGNTITIDDRSSSLVYAGSWNREGTSSELNGTSTWSNMSDSTVSLNFSGSIFHRHRSFATLSQARFLGTQISVWGTVLGIGNGTGPQSNYTIDDETPTLFVALQLTNTQYKQLFFQSDMLAPDNHTLNIKTLVTGAYYYLDFITVVAENSTTTTALVPFSSSTTMSATAVTNNSTAKVGHAGIIVGGVLSGVIFIGMVTGLAILWKRKRDSKNQRVDKFLITRTLLLMLFTSCRSQYNSPRIPWRTPAS